ncbi:trichohyalin [Nematostella vectensis]|uniref:trichohyalin n=1 Tax=Nematostella vectensis TaxID=45351 RepID=UPI0020776531|nr:trichohyalin [Nematostella vectensis]
MLKRIRKTSKQMSRGKSASSLDGLDSGETVVVDPEVPQVANEVKRSSSVRKKSAQEEGNRGKEEKKKENKKKEKEKDEQNIEVENVLKEVASLKNDLQSMGEQLEREKAHNAELKAIKTQQISALTVKLATAIRQKEAAEAKMHPSHMTNDSADPVPCQTQDAQETENVSLRNEVRYLHGEVKRLEEQLKAETQHESTLRDLSIQLATAVQQKEELEALRARELKANREDYQKKCESLMVEIESLKSEVQQLNSRLQNQDELETERKTLKQYCKALESEGEKLRGELGRARDKLRYFEESRNSQQTVELKEGESLRREISRITDELTNLSRLKEKEGQEYLEKCESMNKEIRLLKDECSKQEKGIEKLQVEHEKDLDSMRKKNRQLTEELNNERKLKVKDAKEHFEKCEFLTKEMHRLKNEWSNKEKEYKRMATEQEKESKSLRKKNNQLEDELTNQGKSKEQEAQEHSEKYEALKNEMQQQGKEWLKQDKESHKQIEEREKECKSLRDEVRKLRDNLSKQDLSRNDEVAGFLKEREVLRKELRRITEELSKQESARREEQADQERRCKALKSEADKLHGEVLRLNNILYNKELAEDEERAQLAAQVTSATREKDEALEEVEKLRAELNLLTEITDTTIKRDIEGTRSNNPNTRRKENSSASCAKVDSWVCNQGINGEGRVEAEATTSGLDMPRKTGYQPRGDQHQSESVLKANRVMDGPIEAVLTRGTTCMTPPSPSDQSENNDATDGSETGDKNQEVIAEFHRIQKELAEMRQNMAVVQALNERLSNDLKFLSEKRDVVIRKSTGSRRVRRMASADKTNAGSAPTKFIFPEVTKGDSEQDVEKMKELETMKDDEKMKNIEGKPYEDDIESFSPPNENQRVEDKTSAVNAYEQWKDKEEDVRNQLSKALAELHSLRNDNKEIKEQMRTIAASTAVPSASHQEEDFFLRTTQFTDGLLREMRARDLHSSRERVLSSTGIDEGFHGENRSPRSLASSPRRERRCSSEVSPRGDTTRYSLTTSPRHATDSGYLGDSSPELFGKPVVDEVFQERLGRPSRRSLDMTQESDHEFQELFHNRSRSAEPTVESSRFEPFQRSSGVRAHRYSVPSKLGEVELSKSDGAAAMRRSIDIWGERVRRPLELSKIWKSSETVTPAMSVPGYKDYLQRHIVKSSNRIAKVRDLAPEELYHLPI